jgi:hypothetical protein
VSRLFIATSVLLVMCAVQARAEDTAKAAKTRELLKTKIAAEWKEMPLKEVLLEIKEQVKGLNFRPLGTGVSGNRKVTLNAKEITVEEALAKILAAEGWGYYIISNTGDAYDGSVQIRVGEERGYEKDKAPKKDK